MSRKRLHAHILLDRSGSMEECRDATISAINEYVGTLHADPAVSARISLTLFDSEGIDLLHDRAKPRDVPRLTRQSFVPRGMTPLNDAIGRTVAEIARTPPRPDERVAFVILTDGLENASKEYSREAVRRLLESVQKDRNWLVIYLGANQDAFAEGAARGMAAATTMDFDTQRVGAAIGAVARATKVFAETGSPAAAAFTPAERAQARR